MNLQTVHPSPVALCIVLVSLLSADTAPPPHRTSKRAEESMDKNDPANQVRDTVIFRKGMFGSSLADYRSRKYKMFYFIASLRGFPDTVWATLVAKNLTQPQLADDTPFPCPVEGARSAKRPLSVHQVRPGDIDVIGAMGDSLSAGNGVLALGIFDIYLEDRGSAFSSGGWSNWRKSLTLANILKEFNPRLVGYSSNTVTSIERPSQFNVADPMTTVGDLKLQVKNLAARMKNDQRVNFQNDWKLVTIMVGANDVCGMCYEDVSGFLERQRSKLIEALDLLQQLMVRTIVNLVILPDIGQVRALRGRSTTCYLVGKLECPCFFGTRFVSRVAEFQEVVHAVQQIQVQVANMERYRTRRDFAVVAQPFAKDSKLSGDHSSRAKESQTLPDMTVFSTDCFHFSQKGHALVANSLWNNMLEPLGNKTVTWAPIFERFLCPTVERPYIATWGNSGSRFKKIEKQRRNEEALRTSPYG